MSVCQSEQNLKAFRWFSSVLHNAVWCIVPQWLKRVDMNKHLKCPFQYFKNSLSVTSTGNFHSAKHFGLNMVHYCLIQLSHKDVMFLGNMYRFIYHIFLLFFMISTPKSLFHFHQLQTSFLVYICLTLYKLFLLLWPNCFVMEAMFMFAKPGFS